MKVGVLTSSRADYGIYLPLLKKLESDKFFNLEVIAFGTHLSKYHGYTLVDIEKNNFSTVHKISSLVSNNSIYIIRIEKMI
jgi:GDP/UDP-N,N'-diacetylbacillosamine 2-epimerase (hydrolysing)